MDEVDKLMEQKMDADEDRYYESDKRPECPVYADEDRPDFDPKRRTWFHLHWTDRERFPEVELENARLRAALETIRDATLARSGVAGIADICKEALS